MKGFAHETRCRLGCTILEKTLPQPYNINLDIEYAVLGSRNCGHMVTLLYALPDEPIHFRKLVPSLDKVAAQLADTVLILGVVYQLQTAWVAV